MNPCQYAIDDVPIDDVLIRFLPMVLYQLEAVVFDYS